MAALENYNDIVTVDSSFRSCLIKDVQIRRRLGRGTNSTIFEGTWEGMIVAVKRIHFTNFDQLSEQEQEIVRTKLVIECDRVNRLRHSNIVHFLGIYLPLHAEPHAKIPSVVMEPVHCNLNYLLEQNDVVPLEMKTSILHQVSLGLQYLHSRDSAIVRGNLTSKNVLISKGMEAKITVLGSIRFVHPELHPFGTGRSPEIQDFVAPEILINPKNIYGPKTDVFSFGCIMLHTFSQQWPTPSQNVTHFQSEMKRRAQYASKIPKDVEAIIPLIANCLENQPHNRPTAEEVYDQLKTIVARRQHTLPDNLLQAQIMLHETKCQHKVKEAELEALRLDLSKLQVIPPQKQVLFVSWCA